MSHGALQSMPSTARTVSSESPARTSRGGAQSATQQTKAGTGKIRGRPRSFDVDQAIVCAAALFRKRGYDRVTLADLTSAMAINPPSFYAAFGSKALLFKRVSDAYLNDWLVEIRGAFEGAGELQTALRQIVVAAAGRFIWRDDEDEAGKPAGAISGQGGCLILESANNCSDALVVAHIRKARLTVAAALYRGISHGAPDDVVALTDHVMMLLAGLSAMARAGVGADRLVPMAESAAMALRPVSVP
ncbi:MAG: TetR/AcrR family transcriptional regulator [Sphingobium sp.]|nr:TetR/AcrR family transcriptional regulator [Sphingobium sp.]